MLKDSIPTPPPPYVSFGVFKSTIEQLAESVVPSSPLDRRVLSWLSGADYPALISALRFLGMIDDENRPTAEFRTLVKTVHDEGAWKIEFLAILLEKYKAITNGMDFKEGSITDLEKRFKNYGVSSGQMTTKSVRFLIKALTDAKVPLSPHITKPKPKSPRPPSSKNGGSKMRGQAKGQGATPPPANGAPATIPPDGFDKMPIPGVPNAFIQYPIELTAAHCEMLSAAVTMLRAYVSARPGAGKEKKP